jgi:hypothetical protein
MVLVDSIESLKKDSTQLANFHVLKILFWRMFAMFGSVKIMLNELSRYLGIVKGLIGRIILTFCTLRNSYIQMTYLITTVFV